MVSECVCFFQYHVTTSILNVFAYFIKFRVYKFNFFLSLTSIKLTNLYLRSYLQTKFRGSIYFFFFHWVGHCRCQLHKKNPQFNGKASGFSLNVQIMTFVHTHCAKKSAINISLKNFIQFMC